jgi:predicted metalloprotease with PDZ domain
MRPADMVPYRYDSAQPTPWLWVSEGITDYYADLAMVRSGVAPEEIFYVLTTGKIGSVNETPPVALEDASLTAWIHPRDGTDGIYYPKGSLAGLLLDILIRDGSDNRASLDGVMREVYSTTFGKGRGFTADDWWNAVARAAGGRPLADIQAKYIDGREAYPWTELLPRAGMKLATDSVHEPRIGVQVAQDSSGVYVSGVTAGSMAAQAGVQIGDRLIAAGGIPVRDVNFGEQFRSRYARTPAGSPLALQIERNGQTLDLQGGLRFETRIEARVEPDPAATGKAARIRDGILRGRIDG